MTDWWIKLHRKFLESSIYLDWDSYLIQLWIHILLSVNHKKKKILFNWEEITINEWEWIFGLNQITKDLTRYKKETSKIFQKNRSNYYRRLKILEKIGNIETQKTNKFTLIKVKNWNTYQCEWNSNETQTERHRNSNGIQTKQTRMNKNVNNEKNDKNIEWEISKNNFSPNSKEIIQTPKQKTQEFLRSVETEWELYQQFIDWCVQRWIEKTLAQIEVKKFYNYWTERTPSWDKKHWETCKTFEVNLRLANWFRNYQKFNWGNCKNRNSGQKAIVEI